MVGYTDYANMDPNLLQSFATQGNARAIFEMRRRGAPVPRAGTWAPPTGGPGMAMSGRPPTMPMIERPAYLDKAPLAGTQTLASPPQMATMAETPQAIPNQTDPALVFGNAGRAMGGSSLPGVEQPPYLQRGQRPQQPSGDARIASIANGGDAAGAIQAGAAAADEVSGNASPGANLPGPIGALTRSMASLEDEPEDKYGSTIDQMIQQLMANKDPSANRNMALAQAGFAMAASGSPFFLQAVGQGGQAGLKAYQDAQKEDMLKRVQAAQLAGDRSQQLEAQRAHKAGEALEGGRLAETQRSNLTQEQLAAQKFEEDKRHQRVAEAIEKGQLSISSQSAGIALQNLQLAKDKFADEQQRYKDGLADEKALKQAQIDYQRALAKSQEALGVDRATDIVYTQDGGAALVDKTTGKSAPITDTDGNPIKAVAKGSGQTAAMKNAKYYTDIGLFPSEKDAAAAMLSAKSMAPDKRLAKSYEMADAWLLSNPQFTGDNAKREEMAQTYLEALESAAGAPPAAAQTPSAEAPVSTAAPGGEIVVKSQADIDNAPKGAVLIVNGKKFVKP